MLSSRRAFIASSAAAVTLGFVGLQRLFHGKGGWREPCANGKMNAIVCQRAASFVHLS
jgi:hypothetical protein